MFSADKRGQSLIHDTLVSDAISPQVQEAVLTSIGRLSHLPDVWVEPISRLLRTGGNPIRLRTIHAIASLGTNKLDADLRKLATDSTSSQRLRAAAWSCLASRGSALPDEGFQLLLTRVTRDDTPPLDRLDAARDSTVVVIADSAVCNRHVACRARAPGCRPGGRGGLPTTAFKIGKHCTGYGLCSRYLGLATPRWSAGCWFGLG